MLCQSVCTLRSIAILPGCCWLVVRSKGAGMLVGDWMRGSRCAACSCRRGHKQDLYYPAHLLARRYGLIQCDRSLSVMR